MCKSYVNKNQSSFTISTQIPLIIPLSYHFSSLFYPFAVSLSASAAFPEKEGGQGHTIAFLLLSSLRERAFPSCPSQKHSSWSSNTTCLHPTIHPPTSTPKFRLPNYQSCSACLLYTLLSRYFRKAGRKRRTDNTDTNT